jgi:transcriptional regulator with XRE-family HTH domain
VDTEQQDVDIEVKMSRDLEPYQYLGSCLSHVYLVGVGYPADGRTGLLPAEIPGLPALHDALAQALLEKRACLTGDELRFLRKRLRMPSKEFAALVGLTSEQYSRVENGATVRPTVDRLVRLLYAAMMKLPADLLEGVARAARTEGQNDDARIVASQDEERRWVVTT